MRAGVALLTAILAAVVGPALAGPAPNPDPLGIDLSVDVTIGGHHLGSIFPSPKRIPGKVAAAWFAGWHATNGFPLSKVPWSKYTHLTYAFAETTPDVRVLSLEGSEPAVLPEFVREARKHNVKPLISVGGWTGSRFFSTAVATPTNRTAFVKTIVDFVAKYQLEGVDFDWEYPNSGGIGCNTVNPADTANFLSFLQELRRHPIGKKIIVTAATATAPFNDAEWRSVCQCCCLREGF
ncbi:hypothetical protein NMY22_g14535 [Coprinellus aureogranulatus]|nr:hypothetical protein NMY22_g14535 [Coprinellus aureogranulatus]